MKDLSINGLIESKFNYYYGNNFKMPSKSMDISPKIVEDLLPHQNELQQLGEFAGIYMNPKLFRILVELLNMGADPIVIYNTLLKTARRSKSSKHRSSLQLPQKAKSETTKSSSSET